MVSDNSDRIQELEAELAHTRYERDLLRALLDNLPFYTYALDTNLKHVFSNKLHLAFHGETDLEALVGKDSAEYFGLDKVEHFQEDEQHILSTGEPIIDKEESFAPINGDFSDFITNKFPVKDQDDKIVGIVGYTRDITEEKRQQSVIKAQQNVLREVGTPIIPVAEGVVILPLIGDVDSHRAVDIMRATLAGISQHQADVIIIDITGVPVVDTGVAAYFNRTIQAIKLKGARAIITGISENVAEAIVDLGIDWSHVDTMPDLKSALQLVFVQQQKKRVEE